MNAIITAIVAIVFYFVARRAYRQNSPVYYVSYGIMFVSIITTNYYLASNAFIFIVRIIVSFIQLYVITDTFEEKEEED